MTHHSHGTKTSSGFAPIAAIVCGFAGLIGFVKLLIVGAPFWHAFALGYGAAFTTLALSLIWVLVFGVPTVNPILRNANRAHPSKSYARS